MNPGNSIEVNNITKSFKVYVDKSNTLEEKLFFKKRRKYEHRQVLKGISFEVKKGEAIGLIGHNGCGKSTTLKLLTKIIYPDTGSIEMNGRVSSLIELGAGFHPDLSGRDNIYINASIFGLSRKEADERIDDIIAFSELEEFIDNPVRTYSSGMYMRLAFSVAINVDADILLIDEILAVGDANFQAKCFNKLREIKAKGTTIVIVSHSLGQIEQICNRTIWIHDGLIREEGSPRTVHPIYLDYMGRIRQEIAEKEAERKAEKIHINEDKAETECTEKKSVAEEQNIVTEAAEIRENDSLQAEEAAVSEALMKVELSSKQELNKTENENDEFFSNINRLGNGKVRIIECEMLDRAGKKKTVFATGEDIVIRLKYKVKEPVENAVVGIEIIRTDEVYCYGTNTKVDRIDSFDLANDGAIEILLRNVQLMHNPYIINLAIKCEDETLVDYYIQALTFEMYSSVEDAGLVKIEHDWKFI